jgi:hypothetical protein
MESGRFLQWQQEAPKLAVSFVWRSSAWSALRIRHWRMLNADLASRLWDLVFRVVSEVAQWRARSRLTRRPYPRRGRREGGRL